jgi:stage V sporulation protein B
LRCVICHALFFGTLSFLLLFFGAPLIAARWIGETRTIPAIRLVSFSLPAIALSSCLSGYFVAVRRVWKSACIQVAEEIVRVMLTVLWLSKATGMQQTLCAVSLANTVSEIFAALVLLLLFWTDKQKQFPGRTQSDALLDGAVAKRLLAVTLPVAVAAYARSGLIALEHMLIPLGLNRFGQDRGTSMAAYGTLQSMALPVVLFPCALIGAFASFLIPELTEAHVREEYDRIRTIMQRVFYLTLMFSIGTAGAMILFSHELGILLYHSEDAANDIRLLAPLIPIMYMDSATDAMLKGLGQQLYSMKVNIADASLSVLLVWVLLPVFGIRGYLITIYVTELLNAALSIARLLQLGKPDVRVMDWVAKPLLAAIGSSLLTRTLLSRGALPSLLSPTVRLVCYVIVYLMLYSSLLVLIRAIRHRDLRWMRGWLLPEKKPTHS